MSFKKVLTIITFGCVVFGATVTAAGEDFVQKKNIFESLVGHNYTGNQSVKLTISEKELKDSWVPYANELLSKENKLEGSSIKDIDLNSDGSVKITASLSSALKKSLKIPFISTVQVTARPTADNGAARISVTKLKAGYFPISVGLAQKFLSRWNVNVNNFVIKDKYFYFEKISVNDSELAVEGKYNAPIKAKFSCRGGQSIEAVFYKGVPTATEPGKMPTPSGSLKVTLSDGRKFDLPQTISADGARYANSDESILFWNKGDTLRFFDHKLEKGYQNCRLSK